MQIYYHLEHCLTLNVPTVSSAFTLYSPVAICILILKPSGTLESGPLGFEGLLRLLSQTTKRWERLDKYLSQSLEWYLGYSRTGTDIELNSRAQFSRWLALLSHAIRDYEASSQWFLISMTLQTDSNLITTVLGS